MALEGGIEPEAESVTAILDVIPVAWERAEEGRSQAREGDTVPLADL